MLAAHGLAIDLPPRWSGRIFRRVGGHVTLHAGDFALAWHDGEFGPASTAKMPPGASFVALVEYLPGAGLAPGRGLFGSDRIELPLDPTAFAADRLAHPRPGQVGTQQFLTRAQRPLCLYAVLAGGPMHRRRQLAGLNRVLATLAVAPAGADEPT